MCVSVVLLIPVLCNTQVILFLGPRRLASEDVPRYRGPRERGTRVRSSNDRYGPLDETTDSIDLKEQSNDGSKSIQSNSFEEKFLKNQELILKELKKIKKALASNDTPLTRNLLPTSVIYKGVDLVSLGSNNMEPARYASKLGHSKLTLLRAKELPAVFCQ